MEDVKLKKAYFFFKVVNEDNLQNNLQDLHDAVENEDLVGETLDVTVKTASDDGKGRVEKREDGTEPQQGLIQVKALVFGQNFVVKPLKFCGGGFLVKCISKLKCCIFRFVAPLCSCAVNNHPHSQVNYEQIIYYRVSQTTFLQSLEFSS